jgi:hypothetical protein
MTNSTQPKLMTIIGNCQADALSKFLFNNSHFSKEYKYIYVKPIYILNENELIELYNEVLPTLDLLIIQPISDNYKNNAKYSTQSIINNVSESCKIIIIPSLYFDFYHPFNCSIDGCNEPLDYHDNNLIKLFIDYGETLNNEEIYNKYLELFNNSDFLNSMIIENNLNKSIEEIIRREKNNCKYTADYVISCSNFIINNYANIYLFYTVNHPTKYMFYYVADEVLRFLGIGLEKYDEEIDPLNIIILPIYEGLQSNLNFKISDFNGLLNNFELFNKYLNIYKEINNKILIKYI